MEKEKNNFSERCCKEEKSNYLCTPKTKEGAEKRKVVQGLDEETNRTERY
jgi:hypothetical protein